MRWRRVIEYDGDPAWLARTMEKSIHGTMATGAGGVGNTITEVSSQEIVDATSPPKDVAESDRDVDARPTRL